MPASLDCVLCLMRQSLEAARFATDDASTHRKILETAMKLFLEKGLDASPPRVGTLVHRIIRDVSGDPDPYLREKQRFNRVALEQYPRFQRWIEESADPFETTVRLAIAGNSIDFALGVLDEETVEKAIAAGVGQPLNGSIDELRDAIRSAETILYMGDNAGEIVFDKLLVERLISSEWGKKVTFAVRGFPIVNDAIRADADDVGMSAIVPIIDNGSDGLGVLFDWTSSEFNAAFQSADLVIAKGLANYETLVDAEGPVLPKKIAFLFKTKCRFIAGFSNTKLGDLVVRIQ